MAEAPLFGVAASFATERQLVEAAIQARARALGRIDAFTPAPIPALGAILEIPHTSLRGIGLAAAALGTLGFFGMCAYATLVSYPFIIGGRPAFSWELFVIPSVSFGMLVGSLAVTLAMLAFDRLPQLNHPAFNIDGFERASRDRYFLTIETEDPEPVERFLGGLMPTAVLRVPR